MKTCETENPMEEPNWYKNSEDSSCTDQMLTNTARRFQRSCVIETVHLAFARYQLLPNKYNFENLTPNLFIWEIIKISDIDFSQTCFRKFFKTFFQLPNENSFFFVSVIYVRKEHTNYAPPKQKRRKSCMSRVINNDISRNINKCTHFSQTFSKLRTNESK